MKEKQRWCQGCEPRQKENGTRGKKKVVKKRFIKKVSKSILGILSFKKARCNIKDIQDRMEMDSFNMGR